MSVESYTMTEAIYFSGEPSFLAVESGQEICHHLLVLASKECSVLYA